MMIIIYLVNLNLRINLVKHYFIIVNNLAIRYFCLPQHYLHHLNLFTPNFISYY